MTGQRVVWKGAIESQGAIDGLYWRVMIELRECDAHPELLTIELKQATPAYLELSVTAEGYRSKVGRTRRSERSLQMGGAVHTLRGERRINRVMALARRWHLNSLRTGTAEQAAAVAEGLGRAEYEYDRACDILRERGLFEVPKPDGGTYKYGHQWLLEELPESVVTELKELVQA